MSKTNSVRLHDLDAWTVRTLTSEQDCMNDLELSIYRTCLEHLDVITMGCLIAEPIQ